MSDELTTKEWLTSELAAVESTINEAVKAKAQYLDSYQIAIARLTKGKKELLALLAQEGIKETK